MSDKIDQVVDNLAELSGHLDAAQENITKLRRAIVDREQKKIADLEEKLAKSRGAG